MHNRVNKTACYGAIYWQPLIILLLIAALVLVSGIYIADKASNFQQSNKPSHGVSIDNQQYFEWRLVTSWPKNFPGLGLAPENFSKLVERMSAGRLKIHVHGAGEIVPALGVFDAVSNGTVEMGHTAAYYYKGKIPAAPLFTAIPFGMNAGEMNAWLHYGGGLELWRDLYKPFHIRPFAGGNTGMQMGGWFNKEINHVSDIKGLKMRIPGIAGEVFSRAGGSAVNIPGGELYTSMQTGVIDATEWVGPYNDRSFGLHEVGQHYYFPGWHETSAQLEFEVNIDAWNSLPKDLQAIIEVAARAINQDMLDEFNARNASSLQSLRALDIEPKQFSDDIIMAFYASSEEYYAKLSAENDDFKRIFQSYSNFQKMAYEWMKISERAIYNYRSLLDKEAEKKAGMHDDK